MIDRFLQGTTGAVAKATFSVDGVGVTVTGPTVNVTRADGTIVATGQAATSTGIAGQVQTTLNTAELSLLDRLKLTWVATINAQQQTIVTWVDVVGGFVVSLSQLAAIYPTKTMDECAYIRAIAEERLEAACGKAFVPRYRLEQHPAARCRRGIRLTYSDVRAVRSVTQRYAGVTYAWTTNQIAASSVVGGVLYGYGPTAPGWGNITVGYEHGDDVPDNEASQVCLLVAQEEFPASGAARDARIIRQESDNQMVFYASPTSDEPFVNMRINQFVKSHSSLVG